MVDNGAMLASDWERETAVGVLRDAYVAGRLDLRELRDRAGAAYCARTWEDLCLLVEDIPAGQSILHTDGLQERLWYRPAGKYGPRRPVASMLLLALASLAIVAAAWRSAAAIPLIVLSLTVLSAAGCSAQRPNRPSDHPSGRAGRHGNHLP